MRFFLLLFYLLFLVQIGHTQSKTIYSERQQNPMNKLLKQTLPDLTFLLPPAFTGKGDGIEFSSKNGTGYAKVAIEFVVTNLGPAVSKTVLMVAQLEIRKLRRPAGKRPDPDSVTIIKSKPFGVDYLKPNGSIKAIKVIEFARVPYLGDHPVPSIYSRQIKLRIVIIKEGYGSQKELSVQNNVSDDVHIEYKD